MQQQAELEQLSQTQLLQVLRQVLMENQQLRQTTEQLRAEIERLKRGQSAATPVAKKAPKTNPQKAGRKPGQGHFSYRQAPAPSAYSQPPLAVTVKQTACPRCGDKLLHVAEEVVTITDLPALPQPVVRAFVVEICRCQGCGKRVRGRHPELCESQRGATAHQVGKRAQAAAHLLHYQLGIPVRKVPAVLHLLSGLEVTQSAVTQSALRFGCGAGRVAQSYAKLRHEIKEQAVIHTDDTGWREAGKRAYLMVFDSRQMVVYQIRNHHRNEEVREVIGDDYSGVLTTDRGKSYDAKELALVKQQKCLAHLQRSLNEVLAGQSGRARDFCEALKSQLKEAQAVKRQGVAGSLSRKAYERAVSDIEREVNLQLRGRRLAERASEGLRQQLLKQHDSGNLLRFLHEVEVEATNNAAERALRPAVIARKVWQGTKNVRGTRAFEAFTSVIGTLRKAATTMMIESLKQMMERSPPRAVEV